MSHLIDPCLRATKIAHGIRRGIDAVSPLSGLVPELRILIQEQKNVLSSIKRGTFEKEEAAKHLALYAKTEGSDIADTLTKLSLLILQAAEAERTYAGSLAKSRELFKEIRVDEDTNYSFRKRKQDLEQRLALDRTPTTMSSASGGHGSTTSLASSVSTTTTGTMNEFLHPEMKLLRQETMAIENELEDSKRKRIKKATVQQLEALARLGREFVVIAHYGIEIMSNLDDSPTPAGTFAEDRSAVYDGEAKTAYAVKACMETFKNWPMHAPKVELSDIDLGDFPKDNKQALDAMLKELAVKSGSDWYDLQSPSPTKSRHDRSNSVSSTGSMSVASPRISTSSTITTTYIDGVPVVNIINEIPPTPSSEDVPSSVPVAAVTEENEDTDKETLGNVESIPIIIADTTIAPSTSSDATAGETQEQNASDDSNKTTSKEVASSSASTTTTVESEGESKSTGSNGGAGGVKGASPFVPTITYKPHTTYQANPAHQHHAQDQQQQHITSPPRSRPHSTDYAQIPTGHAPHPLMMQHALASQQQQQQQAMYPPGPPGSILPPQIPMPMPLPMSMPVPFHMPTPMSMPIPFIPGSSPSEGGGGGGDTQRHSQPISVSFPMRPPGLTAGAISPDPHHIRQGRATTPTNTTSGSTPSSSPQQSPQRVAQHHPARRNPHAVIAAEQDGVEVEAGSQPQPQPQPQLQPPFQEYEGPPPDYIESSMQLPAEKREKK